MRLTRWHQDLPDDINKSCQMTSVRTSMQILKLKLQYKYKYKYKYKYTSCQMTSTRVARWWHLLSDLTLMSFWARKLYSQVHLLNMPKNTNMKILLSIGINNEIHCDQSAQPELPGQVLFFHLIDPTSSPYLTLYQGFPSQASCCWALF